MKNFEEKYKKFLTDHSAHLKHKDAISTIVAKLSEMIDIFDIDKSAVITFLVQKIQIRYFLDTISEMNKSIDMCLQSDHYSAVEALSRISIEMSVNLMYILGGSDHGRSKGLLRHYLDKRKNNAKNWGKVASKNELHSSKAASELVITHLGELEKSIPGLLKDPIEPWPNEIRKKFELTGYEEEYRTLFASASDAIHLQSEDIFNLTTCIRFPIECREEVINGMRIEKESFAIYLALCALTFQYNAYISTLEKSKLTEANIDDLKLIGEIIASLNCIHDEDCRAFRN